MDRCRGGDGLIHHFGSLRCIATEFAFRLGVFLVGRRDLRGHGGLPDSTLSGVRELKESHVSLDEGMLDQGKEFVVGLSERISCQRLSVISR